MQYGKCILKPYKSIEMLCSVKNKIFLKKRENEYEK